MGRHAPGKIVERLERLEIGLSQRLEIGIGDRENIVRVDADTPMAGKMFDHGLHAAGLKSPGIGPCTGHDTFRRFTKGTITDHVVHTRHTQVETRRTIDIDTNRSHVERKQPARQPCSFFTGQAKTERSNAGPPVRLPQTGNASTFLIDHYRCISTTNSVAKLFC